MSRSIDACAADTDNRRSRPNAQGDELATNIVYDFATGLVTRSTDPNGKVVTTSYANQLLLGGVSDPYGRPGVVTDPLGHRTTTKYFDGVLKAEVFADLNVPGDGKLRRLLSADQLGRPIRTETSRRFAHPTATVDASVDVDRR